MFLYLLRKYTARTALSFVSTCPIYFVRVSNALERMNLLSTLVYEFSRDREEYKVAAHTRGLVVSRNISLPSSETVFYNHWKHEIAR